MNNSTDLISSFKKIAVETIESTKPVNLMFGSITSIDPFEVLLEQKITLTSNQLLSLEHTYCVECESDIERVEFEVGDNIALLRQQGGQKYLILSKVVVL